MNQSFIGLPHFVIFSRMELECQLQKYGDCGKKGGLQNLFKKAFKHYHTHIIKRKLTESSIPTPSPSQIFLSLEVRISVARALNLNLAHLDVMGPIMRLTQLHIKQNRVVFVCFSMVLLKADCNTIQWHNLCKSACGIVH